MNFWQSFVLILASSSYAQAQLEDANPLRVNFTLGYMFRSTVLSEVYQDPTIPSNYEKNIQGTGINIGLEAILAKSQIGVIYSLNVRYDYYFDLKDRFGQTTKEIKDFLVDHNIILYKAFTFRYKPDEKNKYIGVGINFINSGAEFDYKHASGATKTFDLSFTAINLSLGFPIYNKIVFEPQILFIRRGFPYSKLQSLQILNFRIYYKFYMK